MEERKRPAVDGADSAPPLKRQATSVNGAAKSHPDADMPWQDDLERFQKEAIWRQMQEYKRDRSHLETRLKDLSKRTAYHDDHLRMVDAWFSQLLDEIKLLVADITNQASYSSFPSALLNSDKLAFEMHLQSRSKSISSAISHLFNQPPATAQVSDLQARIARLLADEKVHINELEKSRQEQEQLEQRLEDASLRYMLAEKKLDRVKSLTVQKLEQQAIASVKSEPSSDPIDKASGDGGKGGSDALFQVERARKEADVSFIKQKEQLQALETDNEKLRTQITTLETRLTHLSDDDYSKTDLFKYFKSQHEDVIKRVNDLEATNVKLREEAEKLQAERVAYRVQLEQESQMAVAEKEALLAQAENDLARIRTTRDELVADVSMRKAAQGQERASIDQIRELAIAREERIKALESEIERMNMQISQTNGVPSPQPSVEDASADDLHTKYSTLERQHAMLKAELHSMETAYQKTSAVASQKVTTSTNLEEKALRLGAEKSKADQKYFAAMKAKEAREQEVRTLRAHNSKTSEIVSQLKEAEAASRTLMTNLEKQVAEQKSAIAALNSKHSALQQQVSERNILNDGLRLQVEDLKKNLAKKDESTNIVSSAHRKAEIEIEALRVRLEETQKSLESWKTKGLGNQSEEYEMLRTIALCTVCRVNFKNTAIKTCGHVFCKDCVEERRTSRSRKCPNCNRPFGTNDPMHVTL
ncbi:MAG: hypothetical protein Q9191_003019 [Dirinaria sp. TL-2023a]